MIYIYEQPNQNPLRVPDAGKMSPWQQNEFSSCGFCRQPPDPKLQPHVLLSLVSSHRQQQQQQQPIREQQRRQHAQPGHPGQEQLQTLQQQRWGQHQPDVPELRRNRGGGFLVLLANARLAVFVSFICLPDIR